ncbi:hypothetical protein F4778DRAFT_749141 [Xylariomycetidae sp. FL2044]|nr:hypothetical protein F4778DRAFT_749141 [Xylariomycetidae sp. FL2044]
MPSFRTLLAAVAIFASSVAADYTIDPNSVSLTTRTNWCQNEKSTCPIICDQTSTGTETNTCDPKTLTYGCICSNGLQPNVSEYSLTLPFFICQEWGNQCVEGCGEDSGCASACREDHPCGALNPTRVNSTTISTMQATGTDSGATATDSNVIYTGLAGSDSAPNDNSAFRPSTETGGLFGFFLLSGGLCLGMMLL